VMSVPPADIPKECVARCAAWPRPVHWRVGVIASADHHRPAVRHTNTPMWTSRDNVQGSMNVRQDVVCSAWYYIRWIQLGHVGEVIRGSPSLPNAIFFLSLYFISLFLLECLIPPLQLFLPAMQSPPNNIAK
jgi:hypothetical protein